MKRLVKIILPGALIFSSCLSPSAPQEEKFSQDAGLENVRNVIFLSDTNSVSFEWSEFASPNIKGVMIYRGKDAKSLERVATLSKYSTHFFDGDLSQNTEYVYAFRTFTKDSKISALSEPIFTKTQDLEQAIGLIEAIGNLPKRVKLIFKPSDNNKITGYLIQRKEGQEGPWEDAARLKGRLNAEYLDKGLKDGTTYFYRIYGVTYNDALTRPTKPVFAATRVLPPTPQAPQASRDLPKKIAIKWEKLPDERLTYNLYRSEDPSGKYEKILSQTRQNSVAERLSADGEVYYYRITSVDETDLESLPSAPVKGFSLPPPLAPSITLAAFQSAHKVKLRWVNKDRRVKAFLLRRTHEEGFFSKNKTELKLGAAQEFTDVLKAAGSYTYEIIGIDEHGIRSAPSEPVSLDHKAN